MIDMNWVMFAVGIGVGVLFATACLTGATIYDDYIAQKEIGHGRKRRKGY